MRTVAPALFLPVLLASALLASALPGGGGGSDDPAPADAATIAQQVVQDCALDSLDDYLAILAAFQALLDPDATDPPTFRLTGIDLVGGSVAWDLDLDNDGVPEIEGTFRFLDAQGRPTIPFDPSQIPSDPEDLPDLLATLPDGTRFLISYAGTSPPPDVSGTFAVTYVDGAPDAVSGHGSFETASCLGQYSFDDVAFASLGDGTAYPVLTLDVSLGSSAGTLVGTLALDGTDVGVLEARVDGSAETFRYLVDLQTGQVTPEP